ncbi:hypothetical protein AGLY_012179, partial [Aphis glycines]
MTSSYTLILNKHSTITVNLHLRSYLQQYYFYYIFIRAHFKIEYVLILLYKFNLSIVLNLEINKLFMHYRFVTNKNNILVAYLNDSIKDFTIFDILIYFNIKANSTQFVLLKSDFLCSIFISFCIMFFTFNFDKKLIHSNIKANNTLLILLNTNLLLKYSGFDTTSIFYFTATKLHVSTNYFVEIKSEHKSVVLMLVCVIDAWLGFECYKEILKFSKADIVQRYWFFIIDS